MRIIKLGSILLAVMSLNACVETGSYYSHPAYPHNGYRSQLPYQAGDYSSSQPVVHHGYATSQSATGSGYVRSSERVASQSIQDHGYSSSNGERAQPRPGHAVAAPNNQAMMPSGQTNQRSDSGYVSQ
ncbi:MAG: hypothetical protein P4M14_09440 [Gammaproteobacteria bacterium]|nr:hypothetical protein [Gammaproteobacteria bacterium]